MDAEEREDEIMAKKSKDPYAGWTHADFEKEARQLERDINRTINKINADYNAGKRPDMDGPLKRVKKDV